MTVKEFSDSFDTAVSAWAQQAGYGDSVPDLLVFDEYEKSVFLTRAQDSLVLDYYTGNNFPSFEEKEMVREALDALVDTYVVNTTQEGVHLSTKGRHTSYLFSIPNNLLWIIVEEAKYGKLENCNCWSEKTVSVIPAKHDEYHGLMENPFRGVTKKRVLRFNASNNVVELISDYPIGSYMLRYVKQPNPIILVNLSDDVTIRDSQNASTGSLPDFLHEEILRRAVQYALQSRSFVAPNVKERNKTT